MDNNKSPTRYWNSIIPDVLLKIFMTLNVLDLARVSLVCKSWRKVCQDPILWEKKVFDLSNVSLGSGNLIFKGSRLTQILKCALLLTNGKISCLIFNFHVPIDDENLVSAAERCRDLKRLVLPGRNYLSKMGIFQAMQLWEGLESMTISQTSGAYDIVEAIGVYCKNFSALKVSCGFSLSFARALIQHVPKLRVLSLQSTLVNKDALACVANELRHLEVLNVSHSCILRNISFYRQHDLPNILGDNMSRIQNLIRCEQRFCNMCQEVLMWNLTGEWKDHREEVWREDKISYLRF